MSTALPSHTLSPASPSPHRYDSRGWCNFERAEGQLIKPDGFCIDIGLFTVDKACEEYARIGRDGQSDGARTPLRIGGAYANTNRCQHIFHQHVDKSLATAPLAPLI